MRIQKNVYELPSMVLCREENNASSKSAVYIGMFMQQLFICSHNEKQNCRKCRVLRWREQVQSSKAQHLPLAVYTVKRNIMY